MNANTQQTQEPQGMARQEKIDKTGWWFAECRDEDWELIKIVRIEGKIAVEDEGDGCERHWKRDCSKLHGCYFVRPLDPEPKPEPKIPPKPELVLVADTSGGSKGPYWAIIHNDDNALCYTTSGTWFVTRSFRRVETSPETCPQCHDLSIKWQADYQKVVDENFALESKCAAMRECLKTIHGFASRHPESKKPGSRVTAQPTPPRPQPSVGEGEPRPADEPESDAKTETKPTTANQVAQVAQVAPPLYLIDDGEDDTCWAIKEEDGTDEYFLIPGCRDLYPAKDYTILATRYDVVGLFQKYRCKLVVNACHEWYLYYSRCGTNEEKYHVSSEELHPGEAAQIAAKFLHNLHISEK